MKLPATQVSLEPDVELIVDSEPEETTNVMESGLLRVLTNKSARDGGQGQAEITVAAPTAPAPSPAPKRSEPAVFVPVASPGRRSRVYVIAGAVAAIVLTFDAWLILHHRQPAKPPAVVVSAPAPLPTYMVLPVGSPPPAVAAPSPPPPVAVPPKIVVAETGPVTPAPAQHRHRHGHHRHSTP